MHANSTPKTAWMPSAELITLEAIAKVRRCIHDYMYQEQLLEVLTPALSTSTATDPHIHSFKVQSRFLHTSPEFPMKRLLAAHQRDIYQMATVFRAGELGRYHNPEFSLLEWYRVGFDHVALMQDVASLLQHIAKRFNKPMPLIQTLRYKDAVATCCKLPIEQVTVSLIERVFQQRNRSYPRSIGNDLDAALDLLLDEFVISNFPDNQATFLVDYPASQCALAKVATDNDGTMVAQRFELYWGSLELANGFNELLNSDEQRRRFEQDNVQRQSMGLEPVPLDEHFLNALHKGMPACAGVALGIDRLVMRLCGIDRIENAIAFSAERA